MSNYSFRVEGLDDMKKDLARVQKEFMPVFRKAMVASTATVKRTAKEKVPIYQGELRRGIFDKVTSSIAKSVQGIVYVANVKYGLWIEKGTRPHFPPVEPLEKWGRIKLGKPGIGFLIARKIAKKGTKAQPFMLPALEDNKQKIQKYFEEGVDTVVKMLAGKK